MTAANSEQNSTKELLQYNQVFYLTKMASYKDDICKPDVSVASGDKKQSSSKDLMPIDESTNYRNLRGDLTIFLMEKISQIEQQLNILKTKNLDTFQEDNDLIENESMERTSNMFIDTENEDYKHKTKQFSNPAKGRTDSENSVRNLSQESELNKLLKENKDLCISQQQQDEKILDIADNIELAEEKLRKLNSEIVEYHRLKEVENFNTSSNFFSSTSVSGSSSNYGTSSMQHQPASLPSSGKSKPLSRVEYLLQEINSYEEHIKKLKEDNLQLQGLNQTLETRMQQLRERLRQYTALAQQLNEELNPNSSGAVRLNPKQQQYFDAFRRRLELQVEQYKQDLRNAERQAAHDKEAALQRQTDAEGRLSDLQQRVTHLENEDRKLKATSEELRTALLVATRATSHSAAQRTHATIETLRSAARRLEDDMRRVSGEYDNALAEKMRLQEEIQQLRSSRHVRQTTYTYGPGAGTTTIERSGNNTIIISNEGGVTITQESGEDNYGDIELD